jgi:hypothetical protein
MSVKSESPCCPGTWSWRKMTVSALFGPPGADPALQTTAQPVPVMIGAAALHLLEQGDRPQTRLGLEHRADLGIPEPAEGIGCRAWSRIGGLRRRPAIRLDAAGGTLAEAGLGGGDTLGMVMAKLHEYSHLLACDVSSGHFGPRLGRRGTDLAHTRRGLQTRARARVAGRSGKRLTASYGWSYDFDAANSLQPSRFPRGCCRCVRRRRVRTYSRGGSGSGVAHSVRSGRRDRLAS